MPTLTTQKGIHYLFISCKVGIAEGAEGTEWKLVKASMSFVRPMLTGSCYWLVHQSWIRCRERTDYVFVCLCLEPWCFNQCVNSSMRCAFDGWMNPFCLCFSRALPPGARVTWHPHLAWLHHLVFKLPLLVAAVGYSTVFTRTPRTLWGVRRSYDGLYDIPSKVFCGINLKTGPSFTRIDGCGWTPLIHPSTHPHPLIQPPSRFRCMHA